MSITRDRELADLLYNSVNHLSQLQDDLNVMNSHHQGHQTALTLGENKQGLMDVPHETKDESPEMKALADALKKVAILHRQQEQLINLSSASAALQPLQKGLSHSIQMLEQTSLLLSQVQGTRTYSSRML